MGRQEKLKQLQKEWEAYREVAPFEVLDLIAGACKRFQDLMPKSNLQVECLQILIAATCAIAVNAYKGSINEAEGNLLRLIRKWFHEYRKEENITHENN
mgnify:CR=1 FL=1